MNALESVKFKIGEQGELILSYKKTNLGKNILFLPIVMVILLKISILHTGFLVIS